MVDNPSAFPYWESTKSGTAYRHDGMSLRDYFAAAALQGLLANHKVVNISESEDRNYIRIGSEIDEIVSAETSYRMADAMLKAREVK